MDEKPEPAYDPHDLPKPAGLTTRSEVELSEAIQDCAKKCMGHADPFSCAEACAISLIAEGWTATDARQVQVGALRFVSKLTGDDSLWPTD
jgi:hypothetical protein